MTASSWNGKLAGILSGIDPFIIRGKTMDQVHGGRAAVFCVLGAVQLSKQGSKGIATPLVDWQSITCKQDSVAQLLPPWHSPVLHAALHAALTSLARYGAMEANHQRGTSLAGNHLSLGLHAAGTHQVARCWHSPVSRVARARCGAMEAKS